MSTGEGTVAGETVVQLALQVCFALNPPRRTRKAPASRSLRKRLFMYVGSLAAALGGLAASPFVLLYVCALKAYKCFACPRMERLTAEETVKKMTLEEKVYMMGGSSTFAMGGCPRLGVPPVKFTDGPSGARGMATMPLSLLELGVFSDLPLISGKSKFQDPNTNARAWYLEVGQTQIPDILMLGPGTFSVCAPCGTCLAATFDPDMAFAIGKLIAKDTRQKGANVLLGPTLNLTRTPTGGRNFEAYGEDPFLAGRFGTEWVKGAQSVPGIAACAKHYACNEFERFRMTMDCHVDKRPLHELYLRHFEMVVKEGKVGCIMTGYNKVNGSYACSNKYLLDDVLRRSWGFDGVVMSDWYGTHDTAESAKANLLDLEMPGPPYIRGKKLVKAVKDGVVGEGDIDTHVLRLVRLTEKLRGIGPGVSLSHEAEAPAMTSKEELDTMYRAARDSIVLLKNTNGALPIQCVGPGEGKTIVTLYGPNAANYTKHNCQAEVRVEAGKHIGLELASSTDEEVKFDPFLVEVFASAAEMGHHNGCLGYITLEKGVMFCTSLSLITWSFMSSVVFPVAKWNKAGVKVSTVLKAQKGPKKVANHTFSLSTSGPSRLSVDGNVVLEISDDFLDADTVGWNIVSFGCKPRQVTVQLENAVDHDVVIEWAAHEGFVSEKFSYGFESQYQGVNEACPFAFELKYCSETMADTVLERVKVAAAESDYNVAVLGRKATEETEMIDVLSMELGKGQVDLLNAVALASREENRKSIVCLNAGSPVGMAGWLEKVDGVMQTWYGGQQGTGALAEILLGKVVSPSGKLPFTVPTRFEENPTYTTEGDYTRFPGNNEMVCSFEEGLDVGYRYYDKPEHQSKVLFPFGHGLSYTTFETRKANFEHDDANGTCTVLVKNTGNFRGAEVLQVYVGEKDRFPAKQLQGFLKVWLGPGEERSVAIDVNVRRAVEFFDADADKWSVSRGSVHNVFVGTSAADAEIVGSIKVN
eukprot:g1259.t1